MYRTVFTILVGIIFVSVASAWEGPKVEYSADSYFETADTVMQGKVYYSPGMERRESVHDGQQTIMIMRQDKKVVWMLMPESKTYNEMKIPEEGRKDDLSNYEIETTTVGPETVNGIDTTKNKIIMVAPDGSKMGGFGWISKDGIMIKMDAIAVENGSKQRMKSELKELQVGRQDPALFEIPEGYSKMDLMPGFGSMFKGDDDKDGGDDDAGKKTEQPTHQEKKQGFGWKNAIDVLKKY